MKNTSILLNSFISEDRRFTQYLTTVFQPLIVYSIKGELYCKVDRKSSKQFLIFLKYHTNTLYKQLIDLYGVDYGEKIQRFEICYNLLSILFHRRLNVTLVLSEQQKVQSVCDLYPNSS
jgi:NADH:ubiquinone oxidoreductase subunit C